MKLGDFAGELEKKVPRNIRNTKTRGPNCAGKILCPWNGWT